MEKHYLTPLFQPESIVIFGSEKKTRKRTCYQKALLDALHAQEFPALVTHLDVHAQSSLADLTQIKADLAIIALESDQILTAIEMAGRIKCKSAVIVSTGVPEPLAKEIHQVAQHHGIQLLGPNSLGFQRPASQLNVSVLGPLAAKGSLGLVSQSGALTAAILDWAKQNGVGFSQVVSVGPNTSIDASQVLDYFANDGFTHSIVVYLEGITNSRKFMSALRAAASTKPVVILKAGHQEAGNLAAQTHSRRIVGSDDVFDAAIRRCGAVRVQSFVELFSAAKCLASRYRPVGKNLAIVTNGGGPGVLAADYISGIGLSMGRLSEKHVAELQEQLPPLASLSDLIDLSEDATAENYCHAIETANKDPQIDGILVIHSPKAGTDSAGIAKAIVDLKKVIKKPVLACWMGDSTVIKGRNLLAASTIPTFRTPEAAVGAFGNIANFYQNQQLLQQTPPPLSALAKPDIEGARLLIESVLAERRKVLTEMESKALLSAFHIPVTKTILARSPNEAMMIANQLGYPVALKIDSPDILHKSDVNGVALNVMNALSVRDIYNNMIEQVAKVAPKAKINGVTIQNMASGNRGREVYVGLVTDEAFGPVIAFGAGGTMIELLNDRSMELPPLNQYLARHLIDNSRIAKALDAWRGAPAANKEAIEQILLRISEMVCELPQLREMDINPIIVDENGAVAVDARIVIDSPHQIGDLQSKTYNHLAILPYPQKYQQVWPLPGGSEYSVRPIHPDDAQMLQEFVSTLSKESRYFRFISSMSELPFSMLSRFTLIDYDREMALVAVVKEKVTNEKGQVIERERIVGESRYITNPDKASCEFSLVVADDFNGKGLGSRLMLNIMEVAKDKGLAEIDGIVLSNNPGMLRLMKNLGFSIQSMPDDPDFKLVTYRLN